MTVSVTATELNFKYVTTAEELNDVISVLSTETEIAIDTETANPRKIENPDWLMNIYNKVDKGSNEFAPFDPHTCEVRLVQLRGRNTEPFVVDLWKLKSQDVTRLAKFLETWTGTFIAHNAKFDLKMLKGTLDVWIDRNGFIFDTMQASILLGNSVGGSKERGHKLLDIARDFLEIDLDKTEQASDWSVPELSREQLEYAAYDVTHLHALKDILTQALENLNQQEPLQIEMQVISPTARMEYNGIPVSLPVYNKVQEAAQYAMPLLLGKIGKYFQEQIGQALTPTYLEIIMADGTVKQQLFLLPWGGNKVGKDFLMSRTNLVKQMLLDLGLEIESTEKAELEAYRESHPGIGYLIDYWNLVKQSQFKYDEYMHPKTGRIHSTYKISGASTGRFSSSNLNLQQVPSKTYMKHFDGSMMNYRQCFEAPPGWLMISCDFSGQELCVMAALSGDPLMMKILNEGGDLHSEAAAGMFNIDPKDARQKKPNDPSGKTYRDYGKVCVAADTLVSTDHGLISIKEVKPGMKAYTDISAEVITHRVCNGIKDTFLLTLEGGYQLECTPDHQLRVIDVNGNYVWKEAQDITEDDFVALKPGAKAEGSAMLPIIEVDQTSRTSHKPVELPTQWTTELARFLGYYISEGSCSHTTTSYQVSYSQVIGPIAQDMTSVAKTVWKDSVKVIPVYTQHSKFKPQHLISFNRKDIYNWLAKIGCGSNAVDKQIPSIVFQSPLWAQREFLRALFAGDGCITRNGINSIAISYTSKSEKLVRQVQQLMLNLGCLSSISTTRRKNYPDTYWMLRALNPATFLDAIGVFHKEKSFSSYRQFADITVIPNQEARIALLQPKLEGKLTQTRTIAGKSYNRSHKEKLYECIRNSNPVKLNYSRLALVTSEKQLSGVAEYDYLVELEQKQLAFRKVVNVTKKQAEVYDITVENQHCFLANGVVAHNCMFSLAYGKTADGFAADWKIEKSEAKKLIENFDKRFPVLTSWLKREGKLAETQNYSRLVNGAMRFVGDGKRADKDAAKRAGANYQIQGLSSWMTRKAMILLDNRIHQENLAIELVASVHDELLAIFKYDDSCELAQLYLTDDKDKIGKEKESREIMQRCIDSNCGPHCAARYEKIMGECMKEAGEFYLKKAVPAGFDANVRKYWSH